MQEKLLKTREQISPIKEYLFGTGATMSYISWLVDPNSRIKETAERMGIAGDDSTLICLIFLSATLIIDGSYRIAMEETPKIRGILRFIKEDILDK